MRRFLTVVLIFTPAFIWAQGQPTAINYTKPPFSGGVSLLAPAADNCTTPPYSFTGDATTGVCSSATGFLSLRTGGTNSFSISTTSANLVGPIGLGNTTAAPFAYLYAPAANTFSQLNGGTAGTPVPQTFNIYNFCDGAACATGYERAALYWSGGNFNISTQGAGTGTAGRAIILGAATYVGGTFSPSSTDTRTLGDSSTFWSNAYISRARQGGKSKALTDAAAATAFATVAVATNGWIGGELSWTATSVSGSDQLTTVGKIRFAGAATGTTPVCTIGVIGTDLAAVSGGANTLVCTWTNVVASQTCALSVTCTNDLAGTQAITMRGFLNMEIPATVTFP